MNLLPVPVLQARIEAMPVKQCKSELAKITDESVREREWWIRSNIDGSRKHIFSSAANARVCAAHGDEFIKVIEVLDDLNALGED